LRLDVITREAAVAEQLNNLRTLELQLERNRLEHVRNLLEIDYHIDQLARLLERHRKLAVDNLIAKGEIADQERELQYYQELRVVLRQSQESDRNLQTSQIEQLRAASAQLQESLTFARSNLDALSVRAPIGGTVTALNAEIGQSLARGERIGQIDASGAFKLVAQIDEYYINRVSAGQVATINIDGKVYELRLGKVYPQVRDGLFEVDMYFLKAHPPGIRRGQTLQARLTLGDPTASILVPYGPYYQASGGNWIFVLSPDDRVATRRDVQLGRRNSRYVEVISGLSLGERVITSSYAAYDDIDRIDLN
jgi:HlyD family secretion protein